jgi:hypothetical protein
MTLARYSLWVATAVAGPLSILLLATGRSEPASVRAAAFGAGLAGLNAVAAYAIVLWSKGRSTNVFLGAVLGGMVGRMGLLLAAVALGLGIFDLPRLPLVCALLAYFIIFLVLEMKALHERSTPAPVTELS